MLSIGLVIVALAAMARAEDWNYTLNGVDWPKILKPSSTAEKYNKCDPAKIQSPIDITHTGIDWYENTTLLRTFSFLPNFKPVTLNSIDKTTGYTTTIAANFGNAYISEPDFRSDRIP